jgi:hypothetical protein
MSKGNKIALGLCAVLSVDLFIDYVTAKGAKSTGEFTFIKAHHQ